MKLIDEHAATPSRVVSCTYGNEVSSGSGNASLASKALSTGATGGSACRLGAARSAP